MNLKQQTKELFLYLNPPVTTATRAAEIMQIITRKTAVTTKPNNMRGNEKRNTDVMM